MTENGQEEEDLDRPRVKVNLYQAQGIHSAADMIADRPAKDMKYDLDEDEVRRLRSMAQVGLDNEAISFVLGINPATFEKWLSDHKKAFEEGDDSDDNLYLAISRARKTGDALIATTAFDVAVKKQNVTMLMWLTKVRLGWSEKTEINHNHKVTTVIETQLVDGQIKQNTRELSASELNAIDSIIVDITEEVCQKEESS